jgi:glycosyltransferase involved in cell wall biosynthesis
MNLNQTKPILRIGIDTRDLNIARTGARTYLEEIITALPRVSPQYKFIHLQPRKYRKPDESALGKIREHINYILWKQFELPWLAKKEKCNILYCTDYSVPLFPLCPAVPVFHDAFFWANPDHYNRLWRLLLGLFTVPAARKAPGVVTVSRYSGQEISGYTGIPLDKIVVIPIAPKSSTLTRVSRNQIREILIKYGADPGLPYALHVGVMEKRKNLPRLIEAFACFLGKVNKPYQLVLVGQPGPKQDLDDSRSIKEALRKYGVEEHVVITGYVPDEDLPAFYQGACFYIFPSYKEGFGIPILEAFNCDLPVAAANNSSLPEVCGNAAVLFDPQDTLAITAAMVRISQDDQLRLELVKQGRERAKLYSWDITASQLITLFEKICSSYPKK